MVKLFEGIDGLKKIEGGLENVLELMWMKEGGVYGVLRERILELLYRVLIDFEKVICMVKDVFLYLIGMVVIWYMVNWFFEICFGVVVVLGILFYNMYYYFLEEVKGGMVNFGGVDEKGLDEFEVWFDKEMEVRRKVSWVYVEFLCNLLLEIFDIECLKKLVSFWFLFSVVY